MIITINQKNIDFSLDGEKSLKEVMLHLKNFAVKHQHIITKVLVNDSEIPLEESLASDKPISDIKNIDIVITALITEVQDVFVNITAYIDGFEHLCVNEEKFNAHKENISSELLWVTESLEVVFEVLNIKALFLFTPTLTALEVVGSLNSFQNFLIVNIRNKEAFYKVCTNDILPLLKIIQTSIIPNTIAFYNFFNPVTKTFSLEETQPFLNTLINSAESYKLTTLINIPQAFLEGNEKKALNLIQNSIHLYDFLSLVRHKLEDLNIDSISLFENLALLDEQIINFINSITNALEQEDSVTVNDIVEYEYLPIIDEFINILKQFFK